MTSTLHSSMSRLSTATSFTSNNETAPNDVQVIYKTGASFFGKIQDFKKTGSGVFCWPDGSQYDGEYVNDLRQGHGKQTWGDTTQYEGEFFRDLRHGEGTITWPNGESYKGAFFKDRRHAKGTYSWPNGSSYTGMFYMDRKEGYGVFTFSNGNKFEGLYKEDEREGPGLLTYSDGRQDVGFWHGERLLKLLTNMEGAFSLKQHPQFEFQPEDMNIPIPIGSSIKDTLKSVLEPPPLFQYEPEVHLKDRLSELYIEDLDPRSLAVNRQAFDEEFFKESKSPPSELEPCSLAVWNKSAIFLNLQLHTHKHRKASRSTGFKVDKLLRFDRSGFKAKGPLELASEELILMAAAGNVLRMEELLISWKVHPDVADKQGHTALIAATVNWHLDTINLLLNHGADINQLNDEGVSALAAGTLFFYPIESFLDNIAENTTRNNINENSKVEMALNIANKNITASERRASQINQLHRKKLERQKEKIGDGVDIFTENSETFGDLCAPVSKKLPVKILPPEQKDSRLFLFSSDEDDNGEKEERGDGYGGSTKKINGDFSMTEGGETLDNEILKESDEFESNTSIHNFHIEVTDSLVERCATQLSTNQRVVSREAATTHMGKARLLAVQISQHETMKNTLELLLKRGADPNASIFPMPVLFFAIKAADVEMVRTLLIKGASTSTRLPENAGGLAPLHIAAALPAEEGVEITQLLLNALADPDVHAAEDESFLNHMLEEEWSKDIIGPESAALLGGRTPLQVACARGDNYKNACKVVQLLLKHKANPNLMCNGFSPLALAIASGNDLAIDELLLYGANPSLSLTHGVGSALCVASSTEYEHRRTIQGRIQLIDQLIKAGADILAPIPIGPKRVVGTAVDYAYYMFNQDRRIAHMPYHALTHSERETYNARRQLLAHLGDILRTKAVEREKKRLIDEEERGIRSASPSPSFVFTGAGAPLPPGAKGKVAARAGQVTFEPGAKDSRDRRGSPDVTGAVRSTVITIQAKSASEVKRLAGQTKPPIRKPLFRYCYDCGRSVGVRLAACTRCKEVFYCSKACKLRAWNARHKDECVRVGGRSPSPKDSSKMKSEVSRPTSGNTEKEKKDSKSEATISRIAPSKVAGERDGLWDKKDLLAFPLFDTVLDGGGDVQSKFPKILHVVRHSDDVRGSCREGHQAVETKPVWVSFIKDSQSARKNSQCTILEAERADKMGTGLLHQLQAVGPEIMRQKRKRGPPLVIQNKAQPLLLSPSELKGMKSALISGKERSGRKHEKLKFGPGSQLQMKKGVSLTRKTAVHISSFPAFFGGDISIKPPLDCSKSMADQDWHTQNKLIQGIRDRCISHSCPKLKIMDDEKLIKDKTVSSSSWMEEFEKKKRAWKVVPDKSIFGPSKTKLHLPGHEDKINASESETTDQSIAIKSIARPKQLHQSEIDHDVKNAKLSQGTVLSDCYQQMLGCGDDSISIKIKNFQKSKKFNREKTKHSSCFNVSKAVQTTDNYDWLHASPIFMQDAKSHFSDIEVNFNNCISQSDPGKQDRAFAAEEKSSVSFCPKTTIHCQKTCDRYRTSTCRVSCKRDDLPLIILGSTHSSQIPGTCAKIDKISDKMKFLPPKSDSSKPKEKIVQVSITNCHISSFPTPEFNSQGLLEVREMSNNITDYEVLRNFNSNCFGEILDHNFNAPQELQYSQQIHEDDQNPPSVNQTVGDWKPVWVKYGGSIPFQHIKYQHGKSPKDAPLLGPHVQPKQRLDAPKKVASMPDPVAVIPKHSAVRHLVRSPNSSLVKLPPTVNQPMKKLSKAWLRIWDQKPPAFSPCVFFLQPSSAVGSPKLSQGQCSRYQLHGPPSHGAPGTNLELQKSQKSHQTGTRNAAKNACMWQYSSSGRQEIGAGVRTKEHRKFPKALYDIQAQAATSIPTGDRFLARANAQISSQLNNDVQAHYASLHGQDSIHKPIHMSRFLTEAAEDKRKTKNQTAYETSKRKSLFSDAEQTAKAKTEARKLAMEAKRYGCADCRVPFPVLEERGDICHSVGDKFTSEQAELIEMKGKLHYRQNTVYSYKMTFEQDLIQEALPQPPTAIFAERGGSQSLAAYERKPFQNGQFQAFFPQITNKSPFLPSALESRRALYKETMKKLHGQSSLLASSQSGILPEHCLTKTVSALSQSQTLAQQVLPSSTDIQVSAISECVDLDHAMSSALLAADTTTGLVTILPSLPKPIGCLTEESDGVQCSTSIQRLTLLESLKIQGQEVKDADTSISEDDVKARLQQVLKHQQEEEKQPMGFMVTEKIGKSANAGKNISTDTGLPAMEATDLELTLKKSEKDIRGQWERKLKEEQNRRPEASKGEKLFSEKLMWRSESEKKRRELRQRRDNAHITVKRKITSDNLDDSHSTGDGSKVESNEVKQKKKSHQPQQDAEEPSDSGAIFHQKLQKKSFQEGAGKKKSVQGVSHEGAGKKKSFRGGSQEGAGKKKSFQGVSQEGAGKKKSFHGVSQEGASKKKSFKGMSQEGAGKKKSFHGVSQEGASKKKSFKGMSQEGAGKKKSFQGVSQEGASKKKSFKGMSQEGAGKKKSFQGVSQEGAGKKKSFKGMSQEGAGKKKSFQGVSQEGAGKKKSFHGVSQEGASKKKSFKVMSQEGAGKGAMALTPGAAELATCDRSEAAQTKRGEGICVNCKCTEKGKFVQKTEATQTLEVGQKQQGEIDKLLKQVAALQNRIKSSGVSAGANGDPYSTAALKAYLQRQKQQQEHKDRRFIIIDGKLVYIDNYSNE